MNSNIILIVLGEPNSIFSEILFKYFKSNKFRINNNRIILIGNKELIEKQMKQLKYRLYLNEIFEVKNALKKRINIINVQYKFRKIFSKISSSSNRYIEKCFDEAIKLIKIKNNCKMRNWHINTLNRI